MRYYISDPHFFHNRLNDNMDHRGFESLEAMHEYMINKWNNKVRKNDEVVILGDLSIGKGKSTNEILEKLNGKLYMIKGNHDKWIDDKDADLKRFSWIKEYAEMNDNGRKVILCHYPILFYNGQYRLNENGDPKVYMLYGHVHNTMDLKLIDQYQKETRNTYRRSRNVEEPRPIPSNAINCFCMFSDYEPLTLDEWIELNNKREEAAMYHENWVYDQ